MSEKQLNRSPGHAGRERGPQILWWKILLLAAIVPLIVYAYEFGPPSGVTGACVVPANCTQKEATCVDCHIGTLNSGPGKVTITAPSSYASGVTFPITVTVSDPNQRRWGFELSVRTQAGQQAGTLLQGTDGFTQLLPPFGGIQYISHTTAGTRIGTRDTGSGIKFNFTWQAPNVSAGPVVFNVAANAADGSDTELGDRIYSSSATSQPQSSGPTPSIFDGGVVNNASFALSPAPMAAGSIAAIFGSNLNDGSTVLSSSFGSDGKLLTTLGGASVTISGTAAPMFYSTPGQIGVQIPAELAAATSASVQVKVGNQTSSPQTIFLDAAVPGIFTLSQDGKGQGAILIANSDIFAAPGGSVPGRNARPAKPGEFITIFCTGLGQLNPPLGTGVPAGANTTVTQPTVTLDGVPAEIQYSGTAPGFVGLNQINARVPASTRTANDIPVVVSMGGKQSNTATIAVSP